jgi:thiamine biosynthesis lipoprotein
VLLLWLLAAGWAPAAGAADAAESRHEFVEPHMGTLWSITCFTRDRGVAADAAATAFRRVADLERVLTDYDSESELLRLCRAEAGVPHPVSADLFEVLRASLDAARRTDGAFDVTVGPLVQVWRRARRQREFPDPARIAAARAVTGWTNVVLDPRRQTVMLRLPGMRLDVGGIAKGFAADAALAVLRHRGIRRALVAASGDLAIGDPPPGQKGWRVRVGDPAGRTNVLGHVLELRNVGVSTAGDTEQYVELGGVRYSHVVDPRTGLGLTNRIQVTVVARNATLSDGTDTAICVMGVERGLRMIESDRRLAALIVVPADPGPRVIRSSRFPRPVVRRGP